ncbi:MAG: hypothetical protein ABR964_16515 [Tepidisphaeraceae bacterium]
MPNPLMDQPASTSTPPQPPWQKRPTVVDYYARKAVERARRLHRGFTRQNIVAFLKTLVWVVPLTLLVWIYAEQEQLVTATNVQATIEVRSTDPNRTVTLLSPQEKMILCDLRGPNSNLEQVRASLTPTSPLLIDIDDSTHLGEHEIQTLPKIENNSRFKSAGLTVEKASPESLRIFVDRLEERDVPVEAPPGLLSLQSASFTPATVKIKGPHHVLDMLAQASNGHLAVTADLANLPILNSPGQHAPVAVSLMPMAGGDVTCSLSTVQATLVVKEADVLGTATNLPIYLLASGSLLDKYKITYEPLFYPSVKVIGPPDKIDQINTRQARPIAVLEIEDEDAKSPRPKSLRILDLPPGVHLAKGEDPKASFTVIER